MPSSTPPPAYPPSRPSLSTSSSNPGSFIPPSLARRLSITAPRHSSYRSSDREAELEAAFDDGGEEERTTVVDLQGPRRGAEVPRGADGSDLIFDGEEAMADLHSDPLRSAAAASYPFPAADDPRNASTAHLVDDQGQRGSYDFERPYFPPPTRSVSNVGRPSNYGEGGLGLGGDAVGDHHDGTHLSSSSQGFSGAFRSLWARAARNVLPASLAAQYAAVSTADDSAHGSRSSGSAAARARAAAAAHPGNDGVFANLSAKPERPRRRGEVGPDGDRGEDDDLEDTEAPPSYDTAAADAAPPYWETTIIGPGLGYPLGGVQGWTPGSGVTGAIEDLIVEGLPVGSFFGFAWNFLISMSFQFVGFLLTYLLHTSHSSKCGSRAGLGITLIQYGFYLRARALMLSSGQIQEEIDGNRHMHHGGWWGATIENGQSGDDTDPASPRSLFLLAARFAGDPLSSPSPEAFAASADAPISLGNIDSPTPTEQQEMVESATWGSEWLAYFLMVTGWFLLLSSLLSYYRVHRWARSIVTSSREEGSSSAPDVGGAGASDSAAQMNGGDGGQDADDNGSRVRDMRERASVFWGRVFHRSPSTDRFPGSGRRLGGLGAPLPPSADRASEEELRRLEEEEGLLRM